MLSNADSRKNCSGELNRHSAGEETRSLRGPGIVSRKSEQFTH